MIHLPYSLIGVARLLGYRGKVNYRHYLHSDAWARKREQVHKRSGHRCERCGEKGKPLEVHHKTYARLGHEWMRDLQDLCEDCHAYIHGRSNYDPRPGILRRKAVSALRAIVSRLGVNRKTGR